jgi:hypothetical protein
MIIKENKYPKGTLKGRPKNITKDKMVVGDKKIGRPRGSIKTEYSLFHLNKTNLIQREKKGQHVNKIVRYEIVHSNVKKETKYYFSSK